MILVRLIIPVPVIFIMFPERLYESEIIQLSAQLTFQVPVPEYMQVDAVILMTEEFSHAEVRLSESNAWQESVQLSPANKELLLIFATFRSMLLAEEL